MKVNNYPYLKDEAFLKEIDKSKFIDHYAKIVVLNWQEEPIQEIQGRVVSGTINLDGSSSMRRTCNLTIYADGQKDQNIFNTDNLISINKKIYLEIGIKNNSNYYSEYPIIWFPNGLYIIIDSSIQSGTDGFSISLQLKDKMCLLNGECGGTIPAITQFDEYETVNYNEDGSTFVSIFKPTIYQIIQELVNHFGGEQLGKIIINDIDNRIKKVMKWGGTNPIYIVFNEENKILKYQISEPISEELNRNYPVETVTVFIENGKEKFHYWVKNNEEDSNEPIDVTVKAYEYGQDIGYINSDFYYPSELTANAGETVCDILDKIKNTLGNYEYFYDLEGNFIFQEIKNYMNTSFTTNVLNELKQEDYQIDRKGRKTVYEFNDNEIILSCSRTPQYSNIKNDFFVWGARTDVNGIDIPIRYHLAIDKKPDVGNKYTVLFIIDKDDHIKKAKFPIIIDEKPEKGLEGAYYYEKGKLYQYVNSKYIPLENATYKEIKTSDWRTELYLQGVMAENNSLDSGFYYPELMTEWPKLYDVENGCFYDSVIRNPAGIDYYLDFIDTFAKIGEFSVNNIGRRTVVLNDDSVNCIFESEVPDCVLIETGKEDTGSLVAECSTKGQTFYQVSSSIFNLLSAGGQQNSAFESIKNLLFQYTNYNENISITCLPIYHLEPNTRIAIKEPISGINGDYIISSISLPLDSTGTMTINVTQAIERI